jgi:signal transduction histidine kinase
VEGNADWLKVLLRNLLINAFHHSPSPGEVEIRVTQCNGAISLWIANDCEPITDTEFVKLTDRFYRPSSSRTQGVGLGLSIAQRIADLHGAELRLGRWQDGRGFRAEVRFPG